MLGRVGRWRGPLLAAAVVGAVAPDLDMIRFHLLEHGQVHHHRYPTHIPAVWLMIGAASLALPPRLRRLAMAFLAGVALHLLHWTFAAELAIWAAAALVLWWSARNRASGQDAAPL